MRKTLTLVTRGAASASTIKKLRRLLPLALVAVVAAPAAKAAPSPVHISVYSNARLVSPTTIIVSVSVTCPAGLNAGVSVAVLEQNATNTQGSGFTIVPCTGDAQSLAVFVNALSGAFTPGKAYATGSATAGVLGASSDTDTRQIQIVV
jgi:hypothetical protein